MEGYRDREVYESLGPFLRQSQIVALTGLRRTGKTTILHRIVEDAITGGRDPKDVLYFSFDEFREVRLREVLSEYEAVTGKVLRSGRFLVLLDEVQKLVNSPYYRLRVGDYRVIMDVQRGALRILVLKVGHRGSVYER